MHCRLAKYLVAAISVAVLSGGINTARALECDALPGKAFGAARVIETNRVDAPLTVNSVMSGPVGSVTVKVPFCRVRGIIAPTADSNIGFEVWLPLREHWNGRYEGVGDGGFAGFPVYSAMGWGVEGGYAISATDAGHVGLMSESQWAVGHPEKVQDLGWRSIHETALASKAIVEAFYGKPATHSYYAGCSTGGRQGLLEAQRFPQDYDGIAVGAPANYWPNLLASDAMIVKAVLNDPQGWVAPAKLEMINRASLAACKTSGGLIEDPGSCGFKPEQLACKGGDSPTCLTGKEIATLNLIYTDLRDGKGNLVYPRWVPGDESAWSVAKFGPGDNRGFGAGMYPFPTGFYGNLVYQNPTWTVRQFDLDRDVAAAVDGPVGRAMAAENTDLSAFKQRGGKLIHYHGWHDPAISAGNSLRYYQAVAERFGGADATRTFYRLFLATGMEHCGGGPGPNAVGGLFGSIPPTRDAEHDLVSALVHWVEEGVAPAEIIATHYRDNDPSHDVDAQRPWCEYPAVARYTGHGDPKRPSSYSCQIAKRGGAR